MDWFSREAAISNTGNLRPGHPQRAIDEDVMLTSLRHRGCCLSMYLGSCFVDTLRGHILWWKSETVRPSRRARFISEARHV